MIDQTPGQEPEEEPRENESEEDWQELDLSEQMFPERPSPGQPERVSIDEPRESAGEESLRMVIDAVQSVRAKYDQSRSPAVDPTLVARYVAGTLDEETRRRVSLLELRYKAWGDACLAELIRQGAEQN